jgi:hypothetical protein
MSAIVTALISANVRKATDKHGWDNFLVRWTENWSWEHLRRVWWLWSMLGLSGGIALTLWLSPFLRGQPPNPIHDAATKWKIARNLHDISTNEPALSNNCEVVIVRHPLLYSEMYSNDIKEVLKVVGWKVHEALATEPLQRGLSLISFERGLSRTCLDALKQRFDNDTQPAPRVDWHWIEIATKHMAECAGQCVEIDIGNDPGSQ